MSIIKFLDLGEGLPPHWSALTEHYSGEGMSSRCQHALEMLIVKYLMMNWMPYCKVYCKSLRMQVTTIVELTVMYDRIRQKRTWRTPTRPYFSRLPVKYYSAVCLCWSFQTQSPKRRFHLRNTYSNDWINSVMTVIPVSRSLTVRLPLLNNRVALSKVYTS